MALRPEKPLKPKLIFESATDSAVFERLGKGSKSAGIISGEGGSVTSSPVFNAQTLLNALWSGEISIHDTKTGGELKLENVRLMIAAAIQSGTLKADLEKMGASFRDTGFGSRFIFCDAGSAQGTRFIDNHPGTTEHIEKFNDRLQAILDLIMSMSDGTRQLMVFNEKAKEHFHDFCNRIEWQLNPGGRYERAKDHASKLAENVARIAALLQFFEHGVSEIAIDAVDDAITICEVAC